MARAADVWPALAGISSLSLLAGALFLLVISGAMASCNDDSLDCAVGRGAGGPVALAALGLGVLAATCLGGIRAWANGRIVLATVCAGLTFIAAILSWSIFAGVMTWVPGVFTALAIPIVVLPVVSRPHA